MACRGAVWKTNRLSQKSVLVLLVTKYKSYMIRTPNSPIKSITDTGTSGATNYDFILPQDIDGIVVRAYTGATFTGTNPTADIYVITQASDGNWYDLGNLGQITAAVPVDSAIFDCYSTLPSAPLGSGSIVGAPKASNLSGKRHSGLPIMGRNMRIQIKYGGTQLANTGVTVDVFAHQQSNHS